VEVGLFGHELLGGGLDGLEVGEVDLEEFELAVGLWVLLDDFCDCWGGLFLTAASDIDGSIVTVEDLDEL
jgi:hypothetical protein